MRDPWNQPGKQSWEDASRPPVDGKTWSHSENVAAASSPPTPHPPRAQKHQMGFVSAAAISACAMLRHACVPLEPGCSRCFWLSASKRARFPVFPAFVVPLSCSNKRKKAELTEHSPLKPESSPQISQRHRLEDMLGLGHRGEGGRGFPLR